MVKLYWFFRLVETNLSLNHFDWKWVDLDSILTCVQLSYNHDTTIYTLDTNNVVVLDDGIFSKF